MGVKYLASYFENCYDAFKNVSIREMADRHRRIHDSQPVIIVDGSNVVSWLYAKKQFSQESIYGGQWLQFVTVLKNFQREFEEIGVKLVFIFDGTICASKRQTWIQRINEKAKNITFLFDLLLQDNEKAIHKCKNLPIALRILSRVALIELNVEIHQTNKEVDPDNFIAEYANINVDVFAILSSDSDFIMYDTKPLLSLYHLNSESMQTRLYDRKCFAERYLGIQVKQLPLFACLMGNDTVPFEDLEPFHEKILGRNSFLLMNSWEKKRTMVIQKICNLIRFKKWTGDFTQREELENISEQVFHHKNKANLFRVGLKAYAINSFVPLLSISSNIDSKLVEKINEKHYNGSSVCIYNLFCKNEYGSAEVSYSVI
ncbi:constitutive coactivator of peroxisome proliferator-activated receptor gamma [Trichonephila clavata]|uniref:Constitutive coactivator of peroxisome proliferator-activated receptor gamma n=1 Tax=Trichonephila clavata TaxID=2740835 RepID=A0A8X6J701_TRICU|nr:constitutive coactivator of peroxisome proliferator-activated receptor gamma [Trichonephila clavata]